MDFQKRLLDIGTALSSEEVQAMVFLCSEPLEGKAGAAWTPLDLFSRLMDQGRLSAQRPYMLIELLHVIQRAPLARPLELQADSEVSTPERSFISSYRKLLYSLSEDLTDSDLHQVKFLLNKELPRKRLDKSATTLEVFVAMEHTGLISCTDLTILKNILQKVCPILTVKIKEFETKCITENKHTADEEPSMRCQDKPFALDPMPEEKTPLSHTADKQDVPKVNSVDECETRLAVLCTETSEPNPSEEPAGAVEDSNRNTLLPVLPGEQASVAPHTDPGFKVYPMERRGICLIINNYDFRQSPKYLKDREGTMVDRDCLRKVFQWLGFQVVVENDCQSQQMLALVRNLGDRDHSDIDCLVCCVLSHGKEDGVYGVDGVAVPIKQLTQPFDGTKCPSLAGKPKLFFIQACQGDREQNAVYIESDGPSRSRGRSHSLLQSDAVAVRDSIPADADFLLGMATVNFFASYRDKISGTWYIQTLCQNLVQSVPRGVDLLSILTKVNADVSQKTNHTGKKQMPQPAFSLTKRVVFHIPNEPPPEL